MRRLALALVGASLLVPSLVTNTAIAEGPCDVVPDGYTLIEGTNDPDDLVVADLAPGNDGPFVIRGYDGDDTIRGGPLDDIICGGNGFDLIQGAGGNDMEYGEAQNDVHQTSPPTIYYQDLRDPDSGEGLLLPESDGGNAALTVSMEVPSQPNNTMGDINVRVWMSSDPGGVADIAIYTVSPFDVLNKMMSEDLGRTTNPTQLQGTTFDSEAVFPIKRADATSHLGGRFHPQWSLDSYYRYKPADGIWRLRVLDRFKNGIRTRLEAWSLEINYMTDDHDGSDLYDCGKGTQDLTDYTSRKQGVNVSLNRKPGDGQEGENDTAYKTCEWIYSGFGRDKLRGNGKFNDLRAGANNDKIIGKKGDDRFRGGNGNDYLDGGPGTDKLDGNDGYDTCTNGEQYISCEKRI